MQKLLRAGRAGLAALVVVYAPSSSVKAQRLAASDLTRGAEQVLEAFEKHQIVMLGEQHQSAPFYDFMERLVSMPRFADVVNDIVVESGNVRYQPLLDRFIAGEQVPHDSLLLVWRNTTQLLAWDSPVYERFLQRVRAVNAALPRERRLRVLASDPPIDWSATNAASDIPRSYGYRDWQGLAVLEQEVLARGRRALVIIGGAHLYRYPAREGADMQPRPIERASLGDALNRKHPGAAYLIETLSDRGDNGLAAELSVLVKPGSVYALKSTPLGARNARALFGNNVRARRMVGGVMKLVPLTDADFPPLADEIDALLYLGRDELVPPPKAVYDRVYLAEVRRRIKILSEYFGADIWTESLDELVGPAKAP